MEIWRIRAVFFFFFESNLQLPIERGGGSRRIPSKKGQCSGQWGGGDIGTNRAELLQSQARPEATVPITLHLCSYIFVLSGE